MKSVKNTPACKKYAMIFSLFLLIAAVLCTGWILSSQKAGTKEGTSLIAEIYQNGVLLQTIDLSAVTESTIFTLTGENGCSNTIEVRPGSIGILSADCPDKLCVRQGFHSDSLLPITCLPNRLVIQISRKASDPKDGPSAYDATTY